MGMITLDPNQLPGMNEDWGGAVRKPRRLLDMVRGALSSAGNDESTGMLDSPPAPSDRIIGNDMPDQGGFSGNMRRPKLSERVQGSPTLMRPDETAPNVTPTDSDWTPITGGTPSKAPQSPLGWKGRLMEFGKAALPVALGAAVGGGQGAAMAAAGEMGGYGKAQAAEKLQQGRLDESAQEHQQTLQAQVMRDRSGQPLRDAQAHYYDARANELNQPTEAEAPKTQVLEGPDGMPHVYGWNAKTGKFDTDLGKHFVPDQKAAQGDEFERLWNADPKNVGKKPTLQDKINYENKLRVPREPNEYADWKSQHSGGQVTDYLADRAGAAPTASTRTMLESAPKVKAFVDRIDPMIDQINGKLGPVAGRWSEFWQGKVGAGSSEDQQTYTKLRTDVGLLQTMLMRMHVGARGGEYIMKHFQDIVDQGKQSPENMKAALGEIKWYAEQLMAEGNQGTARMGMGKGGGAGQGQPLRDKVDGGQPPQGKWNIHTGRYE